jgi:hypothetical protein
VSVGSRAIDWSALIGGFIGAGSPATLAVLGLLRQRESMYFSALRKQKAGLRSADTGSELGGRYWDRTSDLLGVNEALSR